MNNEQFFCAIVNSTDEIKQELRDVIVRHSSDFILNQIKPIQKESTKKDLIIKKYNENPNFNRSHFACEIGTSRVHLQRIIKEYSSLNKK